MKKITLLRDKLRKEIRGNIESEHGNFIPIELIIYAIVIAGAAIAWLLN
jgi:hypothetical protein